MTPLTSINRTACFAYPLGAITVAILDHGRHGVLRGDTSYISWHRFRPNIPFTKCHLRLSGCIPLLDPHHHRFWVHLQLSSLDSIYSSPLQVRFTQSPQSSHKLVILSPTHELHKTSTTGSASASSHESINHPSFPCSISHYNISATTYSQTRTRSDITVVIALFHPTAHHSHQHDSNSIMPCDLGHYHPWPASGLLRIWPCERYCGYCIGTHREGKRHGSSSALREHAVCRIHKNDYPEVVVQKGDNCALYVPDLPRFRLRRDLMVCGAMTR